MAKQEGYLLVDHQASPGLPEGIARKLGLDPKLVGEGKVFETATLTCGHCGLTQWKRPDRVRERGYCYNGNHYICDTCAVAYKVSGICRPFNQVVDDVLDGKTPIPVLAKNMK